MYIEIMRMKVIKMMSIIDTYIYIYIHLYVPVSTNNKDISQCINWCVTRKSSSAPVIKSLCLPHLYNTSPYIYYIYTNLYGIIIHLLLYSYSTHTHTDTDILYVQSDLDNPCFCNPYTSESEHMHLLVTASIIFYLQ